MNQARADVVVVAYNSADTLRACVAPLAPEPDLRVVVVDNASPSDDAEVVADLGVDVVRNHTNGGFAYGCNAGWRTGAAPYVLLLNPDARISPSSVRVLCDVLDARPDVCIAAPRIMEQDGQTAPSLRRYPRPGSTIGYALGLRRILPSAEWTDEVIRAPGAYESAHDVEWASGACLLVRRCLLDELGGLDEGFFLYCEDKDLCRRATAAGCRVRYEPAATCTHVGGASAPRAELRSVLTASRVRYARTHLGRAAALGEIAGIALGEVTHALGGGAEMRGAHRRAAGLAASALLGRTPPARPPRR